MERLAVGKVCLRERERFSQSQCMCVCVYTQTLIQISLFLYFKWLTKQLSVNKWICEVRWDREREEIESQTSLQLLLH